MVGGGIRRMAVGGLIGGAVGGGMSEQASTTGRVRDAVAGAAMGLGVGALTTRSAFGIAKGIGVGGMAKLGWGATKMGTKAGIGIGKAGFGIGRWALKNPKTALLAGGGLAAGYGVIAGGAPGGGVSTEDREAYLQAVGGSSSGFAPGMGGDFRALAGSAGGLVQGLHRGRH